MQVEPAMAGKVLGADAVKGVMRYQHKNFLDNLPVPRASAVVSDLAHRLLVFPFSVCALDAGEQIQIKHLEFVYGHLVRFSKTFTGTE